MAKRKALYSPDPSATTTAHDNDRPLFPLLARLTFKPPSPSQSSLSILLLLLLLALLLSPSILWLRYLTAAAFETAIGYVTAARDKATVRVWHLLLHCLLVLLRHLLRDR